MVLSLEALLMIQTPIQEGFSLWAKKAASHLGSASRGFCRSSRCRNDPDLFFQRLQEEKT